MLNGISKHKFLDTSQLVRLRGKHIAQTAHCALEGTSRGSVFVASNQPAGFRRLPKMIANQVGLAFVELEHVLARCLNNWLFKKSCCCRVQKYCPLSDNRGNQDAKTLLHSGEILASSPSHSRDAISCTHCRRPYSGGRSGLSTPSQSTSLPGSREDQAGLSNGL